MKSPTAIDRLRRFVATAPWLAVTLLSTGCALQPVGLDAWERHLGGSTIALLGEVHDNADGQAMRLAALRRALDRGWRPAILMEQFDTDRQALIDQSRNERPGDVGHLIERAGGSGWDWTLYRPLVQLALDHHLPLIAANLARTVTRRLVREDAATVLGAERARALGLDLPLPAPWQAAQQRAIDIGHCGALPAAVLPGMVRSQSARDAVIAELLARHRADGVVLIAGNGHVRRDIGVPRWLQSRSGFTAGNILAVGYLESASTDLDQAFDVIVAIPPKTDRPDPCRQFAPPAPAPSTAPASGQAGTQGVADPGRSPGDARRVARSCGDLFSVA